MLKFQMRRFYHEAILPRNNIAKRRYKGAAQGGNRGMESRLRVLF